MNLKIFLFTFLLLINSLDLYAKSKSTVPFLLKANDSTSFMNYEFHNLAYEAAVKKDYKNAFRIYSKLANKGDERAEYNIGMMYMKGVGVARKKMDAYKWLRRASKHGNKEASLYFKQMNDRYAAKHQKKLKKKKQAKEKEILEIPLKKEINSTEVKKQEPIPVKSNGTYTMSVNEEEENFFSSSIFYLIIVSILAVLMILAYKLKSSKSSNNTEKKPLVSTPTAQTGSLYKGQLYDITYAQISSYHTELLKHIDINKYKDDKSKMQKYYMFLAGVIDYFCQLQKFNDTQQRRIFNTHMGQREGKENLTSVTQAILEGQRDHSMYHVQAAGGISAQAWHENKSKDALSMLKKVMTEEHQ